MSDCEPLVQLGLPLRKGDPPYVIVRLSDMADVETAEYILNQAARLAPLIPGAAAALEEAMHPVQSAAFGAMQAGGLAPQVLGQWNPGQPGAPAPDYTQAPAPAPQAPVHPGPQAVPAQGQTGPCWAANKNKPHDCGCTDCGGPTILKGVGISGGRTVNAHVCQADPNHKRKWCDTPAWNSKAVAYRGQGGVIDPSVVLG